MKRLAGLGVALFVVGVAAAPAFAEEPIGSPGSVMRSDYAGPAIGPSAPAPSPSWGTASWNAINYAAIGFTPLSDGAWNHFSSGWSYKNAGSNTGTCVDVHLSSGALLQYITTYSNDTDATFNITYNVLSFDLATNVGTTLFSWTSSGAPGIEHLIQPITPAVTINNEENAYAICVFHGTTGTTLENGGATLWYHLQVSPAPGSATFSDVPTSSPYFRYVEALFASGIVSGCGSGNYCPANPVTRGQMAVFLAVALGMHFAEF
jgi:hypothetical protein